MRDLLIYTNTMFYVYILTNFKNSVFYIGVSNNLKRRVYEHKNKLVEGFSKKYNLYKLIYFEEYSNPSLAIEREKKLKRWKKEWKMTIIKKVNPDFKDLSLL